MDGPDDIPVAATVVLMRECEGELVVLMMRRPERGSFAGAWVFPGGKIDDADRTIGDSEERIAERAGIRETAEEVGLVAQELTLLSLWQPPRELPVRIRTWFFLGVAQESEPVLSVDEVVEVQWISPADALERHAAGEWVLFPPTWMTLDTLRDVPSIDDARSLAASGVQRFDTQMERGPDGAVLTWGPLRLHAGALPWWVERRPR